MKYFVMAFCALLLLTNCKKKQQQECTRTFGTTAASADEEKMVTDYLASRSITATEFENTGMYYVIDAPGNNNKPKLCGGMNVKYSGRFTNDVLFDPRPGSGSTQSTASFTLGALIEGWNRAMPLIGEGGKIRLFVPPALAYGANGIYDPNTGLYTIPRNAMLIFEVELLSKIGRAHV